MAVKVIETVTCDKCGADATDAHPDVTFKWQGVYYTMDLCDLHYGDVALVMKRLVEDAQRIEVRETEQKRLRMLAKASPDQLRQLKRGA